MPSTAKVAKYRARIKQVVFNLGSARCALSAARFSGQPELQLITSGIGISQARDQGIYDAHLAAQVPASPHVARRALC